MKRVSTLVASATRSSRFLSNSMLQQQQGLLLKINLPSVSSYVLYSGSAENSSNKEEKLTEKETINFSLKNGNVRLSAEYFAVVKKAVGADIPDDKFVIPRAAYDALAVEYDAVREEASQFKDKYTRALAETENVRRRGMKQVEEAKLFTLQKFSKDLIGVRDILDLAVNAVKQEDVEENPKIKAFHEGILMTCKVFEKTLTTHGIDKVSPVGEKFNPNMHEAVFQVPKDKAKHKPGHVEEVMTVGYSLNGRPIRAAKVAVVAD